MCIRKVDPYNIIIMKCFKRLVKHVPQMISQERVGDQWGIWQDLLVGISVSALSYIGMRVLQVTHYEYMLAFNYIKTVQFIKR